MRPAAARAVLGRRAFGAPGPRITGLSISGTAGVGEVLTATTPTVEGDGPFDIAWAWLRAGSPIAGASGTSDAPGAYTQVVADAVANSALARLPLALSYTATDANGRSRTVVSNAIAGPALATDDAASVSASGPAVTGNLLTNDPTGSATVTAVTVGVQSVTVGVAIALTGGGTLTVESTGAWEFDPDGDFGSTPIGQFDLVEIDITRSDGGTQTLTVTVLGTAEVAYMVDPANITSAENPESWTWTGDEGITVLEAGGEFPAAITAGDLGIRRAVLDGVASWNYAYTESPPLAAVGLYVAMAADGATGEIAAALSTGGNGLVLDYTGGNLRATLTDDAAFSASVSVAMPASGSFMVGVTVNTAAGILGISVTTGASSAAVAVTTSIAGYAPVTLATLRFGRFAGLCYYGELLSPAFVSAARLQSDLAHASRAGVYHNAGPAYSAPGSLSLADAETDVTLDVSSGASGGETPYAWAVGSITGDWSGVTIDSSGVITADTDDLASDGTAGALVTVTDARGLSASDTIGVTVTTGLDSPADIADLANYWDASIPASITDSAGLVSAFADQVVGGRNLAASTTARPTTGIATIGGLNAIRFNGTTNVLTSTATLSASNSSETLWAVVRVSAGITTTGRVVSVGTSGVAVGTRIRADADRALYRVSDAGGGVAGTADTGEAALTVTTAMVLIGTTDGTTARLYANGTQVATGALTSAGGGITSLISLGAGDGLLNPISCDIAAAGRYTRPLTAQEAADLSDWAMAKWSIA
jgi:VCBS repeat-containing protein